MSGADNRAESLAAWTLQCAKAPLLRDRVGWVRESQSCRQALSKLAGARLEEGSYQEILGRGFELVCLTEKAYPRLLKETVDPPIAMTIWGELRPEDRLALAVVGSRRASPYGLEMCNRIVTDLARMGFTIVSGLARGIDAAAHRAALEASGRTIAVLGSGLNCLYPREHRALAERVAASGAVVSEFPLEEPPHARNFPRRNRILTGLALGTLVVEAAVRSGSLISARHALEQDREVFALPGSVLSATSDGVHALIQDGASLVTSAEDIAQAFPPEIQEGLQEKARELKPKAAPTQELRDGALSDDERAVLAALEGAASPLDGDDIAAFAQLPAEKVLAALLTLEMRSAIWSLPGGLFQAKI